ncbi:MAG: DUF3047 domain-containing protein [Thermodesulfobacteriota bacterium]
MTFEKIEVRTDYRLVDYQGTNVMRAEGDATASNLIRRMRIDPMQDPGIER